MTTPGYASTLSSRRFDVRRGDVVLTPLRGRAGSPPFRPHAETEKADRHHHDEVEKEEKRLALPFGGTSRHALPAGPQCGGRGAPHLRPPGGTTRFTSA